MTAFIVFASFIVGIITGAAGYVTICSLVDNFKNILEGPSKSASNN